MALREHMADAFDWGAWRQPWSWRVWRQLWRSPIVRISVAVMALALLAIDTILLLRSILGDPYWLISTDAGLYFKTAREIMSGGNPYAFAPNPDYRFYGVPAYDRYVYPPMLADLLVPLLLLGDLPARICWTLLVVGSLVLAVILLLRGFGNRLPWPLIFLLLGLAGLSRMVKFDLYHAQVNYPLLFLITLGAWLYVRPSPRAAGLVWGILPVVKPFLGVIVLYLLWRRSWTTALTAVVTSALLLVLSFVPVIWQQPQAFQGWIEASLAVSAPTFSPRPDHISLHGVVMRLFVENPFTIAWFDSPWLARGLHLAIILLAVALFVWVLPSNRYQTTAAPVQPALVLTEIGFTLALVMTYGPATSGAHVQLLLPLVVGLVMLLRHPPDPRPVVKRLWRWATLAWLVAYFSRFSPVALNQRIFGTLFDIPAQETWVPPAGLAVLNTIQGTVVLLIALALLAAALRYQPPMVHALWPQEWLHGPASLGDFGGSTPPRHVRLLSFTRRRSGRSGV